MTHQPGCLFQSILLNQPPRAAAVRSVVTALPDSSGQTQNTTLRQGAAGDARYTRPCISAHGAAACAPRPTLTSLEIFRLPPTRAAQPQSYSSKAATRAAVARSAAFRLGNGL
jgi:hypothetical protein